MTTKQLERLNGLVTEFAYGDRIIGKLERSGASFADIRDTLLKRKHDASVIRAGRKMLDPARVGGVVRRNQLAHQISWGRTAPSQEAGARSPMTTNKSELGSALYRLLTKT